MREELSNLYFDGKPLSMGREHDGTFVVSTASLRKLFLFICCFQRKKKLRLCVLLVSVFKQFFYFPFEWQSKLWFTISIEDYIKWTIKAQRQHNSTTTFSSLNAWNIFFGYFKGTFVSVLERCDGGFSPPQQSFIQNMKNENRFLFGVQQQRETGFR